MEPKKVRWFWLLSDGKTVREITQEKARKLLCHPYNPIRRRMDYALIRLHPSEINFHHCLSVPKAQMVQLIPILSEWGF